MQHSSDAPATGLYHCDKAATDQQFKNIDLQSGVMDEISTPNWLAWLMNSEIEVYTMLQAQTTRHLSSLQHQDVNVCTTTEPEQHYRHMSCPWTNEEYLSSTSNNPIAHVSLNSTKSADRCCDDATQAN